MDHENGTGITTLNDLTWRIAQLSSQNGGLGMENLKHVRYAATIAAIISAGGGIYNEKSMENPLTPDEQCSIVRDFHQAHAIILQVDASLTWSRLKEMSKRTASTLQHTITALLQKQDLDKLLAREPGPNALPYAHYNWFSSLQQKEAGLWLTIYKTNGFKFSNEEFQVALLHRCFGVQPSLLPNFT
eukprot:gene38508-43623_t